MTARKAAMAANVIEEYLRSLVLSLSALYGAGLMSKAAPGPRARTGALKSARASRAMIDAIAGLKQAVCMPRTAAAESSCPSLPAKITSDGMTLGLCLQ